MKTIISIILFSSFAFSIPMNAQVKNMQEEYEKFKKSAETEYGNFRKKANEDYVAFMKKAWEEFMASAPVPKPKDEPVEPIEIPIEEEEKPIEDNEIPVVAIVPEPEPIPQPKPIEPIKEQPVVEETTFSFSLYGTSMKVRWDDSMKFSLGAYDENSIAAGWEKLATPTYDNLIRDCLVLRMSHNLCDWAYLSMLKEFSQSVLGKGTNEATLLTAYLYCSSGYKMRLGQTEGKLYLLYNSDYFVFERLYFSINDQFFYPLDFDGQKLSICNIAYPKEQGLSFEIRQSPALEMIETDKRTLTSERYKDVSVTLSSNKNLIDFFNKYPSAQVNQDFMTRWAICANTPMSDQIKNNLYPQLKTCIQGLTPKDAVERLLNWVQTAFVYEYDDKVWGGDRAFFSDETLFYPYCDCEDRSILLTRIVRDLLNLDCALVYYPGHIATAIALDDTVKGDYIMINNKRFVICDPTYIGAPIGMTMPDMDNKSATVVVLK